MIVWCAARKVRWFVNYVHRMPSCPCPPAVIAAKRLRRTTGPVRVVLGRPADTTAVQVIDPDHQTALTFFGVPGPTVLPDKLFDQLVIFQPGIQEQAELKGPAT